MEHEVFVPFPAGTVRQALVDPARIARCVPGLQLDTDEDATSPDTLTGRLQVRIAGSSITYRGSLRIIEQDDGDLAVTGEGREARGGGSAKLDLTVHPASADHGTTLGFTGTVTSEGRLAESDDDAATAAARRILDRFGTRLTTLLGETSTEAGDADADAGERRGEDAEAVGEGTVRPEAVNGSAGATSVNGSAPAHERDTAAEPAAGAEDEADEGEAEPQGREARDEQGEAASEPEAPSEEPEASTEAGAEPEAAPETPTGDAPEPGADDLPAPGAAPGAGVDGEPPAPDAALARRTMIGRSAEEVDHAPPRGRYAPVPPPEPPVVAVTLRWAAPAAAVAVASAVVLGRLLRRRRR